jgi:hypothetical protein
VIGTAFEDDPSGFEAIQYFFQVVDYLLHLDRSFDLEFF